MSSTAAVTNAPAPPHGGADHYSLMHVLLQLALATLFFFSHELDRIFNLWLLLVPILLVPTVVVGITWLISIGINLFKRRWRRLASAVVAPIFVALLAASLLFSGIDAAWVRFHLDKDSYYETVKELTGPHPRHYSWNWGSTGGAAVVNILQAIEYDESDQVARRQNESLEGGIVTVREFGNHFYLVTTTYP
jgi:hypothetical protein